VPVASPVVLEYGLPDRQMRAYESQEDKKGELFHNSLLVLIGRLIDGLRP
jgi:hypothetical protein